MLTSRGQKGLGFALVSALALIWLVPIAMMLAVAFMPPELRAPRFGGLQIKGVSTANFATAFHDAPMLRHLVNSLVITLTLGGAGRAGGVARRLRLLAAALPAQGDDFLPADPDLDAADPGADRADLPPTRRWVCSTAIPA